LYETAYGFSRLRTYTHVFMIWLALLLVAVVVLEVLRREPAIGLALVLASLGFVVSLGVLNVDSFIVRHNIEREIIVTAVQEDKTSSPRGHVELDANYFLNLSDDGVPAMADGFRNKALPVSVREEIGAALACKLYDRKNTAREIPWQGFHLSHLYADRAFAAIGKSLGAYEITDTDWPVLVKTPGGDEFSCSGYFMD
jgi:hypothetical protein